MALNVTAYIVRHGETEANRRNVLQGHKDYELNDQGRKQAEKAAKKLSQLQFDVAFTSDLARASQTCDIILKDTGTESRKKETLRERKYGDCEDHSKDKFNSESAAEGCDPAWNYTPKGGETVEELRQRAANFFRDFCDEMTSFNGNERKNVLIASHGGLIRVLLAHLVEDKGCELPENADYKMQPPNCGITTLEAEFDLTKKALKSLRCLSLHDVSHMN